MTAGEIAEMAWELSGEDSRYDGDDLTTTAGQALLAKLNSAYAVICSYKFPRTGVVRFRALEQEAVWENSWSDFVLSSATTATSSTVESTNTDGSVGDIVVVGGKSLEILRVVSSGSYQVAPPPGVIAASTSGVLYKSRRISLVAQPSSGSLSRLATAGRVIEVFDIYDLTNRREVYRGSNVDFFDNGALQPTSPSEYIRWQRDYVLLDTAPTSTLTQLRIRYAELPSDFTLAADEPLIPEQFHEAIAKRLAFVLRLRIEDYEAASRLKRSYEDDLRRLQTEYELNYDTTPGTVIRE